MKLRSRKTVATITALAALGVGGGVAYSATQDGGDSEAERTAFLADAAGRLGVEPSELESALEQAAIDRVEAAVQAGRLTEEQGARVEEAIRAGRAPLFGHPGHPGHRGPLGRGLHAAADYLGIGESTLLDELRSGKSLAEVAEAHGKAAAGLVDALVAEAGERLDQAVAAGRLTREEANRLLDGIRATITVIVDHAGPLGPGPDGAGGAGF